MYKGNSNMVAFYMNACIQPKIQLEIYEIIINIIYVLWTLTNNSSLKRVYFPTWLKAYYIIGIVQSIASFSIFFV